MLGKPLDSPEVKLLKELGYPYEFLEDEESKGAQYKYGNGTYRPEEAVAFVLSYAKQIAEAHAALAAARRGLRLVCRRRPRHEVVARWWPDLVAAQGRCGPASGAAIVLSFSAAIDTPSS